LIAFRAEYNRFRNRIQRSAARKSREGTSIILARFVWECQSTRNCLVDDLILRTAARS
jgi:predicted metal-binding transcription factor (methanogenesis marker protein 9)